MIRRFGTYIKLWATLLATLLVASGCKGPKEIPSEDLVKIFHDAFLANAYIDQHLTGEDSLKVYESIFERYGYTLDDVQHTIKTFSERKSERLSDLVDRASVMLEAEMREHSYKVMILDTIDRVAQRTFTHTLVQDSLIHVTRLKDTTKIQLRVEELIPGKYTVSFDYLIDSLDENRNSRIELHVVRNDSTEVLRHTSMMSRHRAGKYSRELNIDSTHKTLCLNMFYHTRNEERVKPDVKITNLKIVRVLPADVAVDSLYYTQLNMRIFNHRMMTSFTADTLPERDSIHLNVTTHEPQDSVALRTN